MGDRTHIELYFMLLNFLERHGCSLSEYGSAERGLNLKDALAFVELLRVNRVPLLGVELWRCHAGLLEQDLSEIWYSEGSSDADHYSDANGYFNRIKIGSGDVFAIQFG